MEVQKQDQRKARMAHVLQMTNEATRLAGAADWAALRALRQERDALLRQFFAEPQDLGEARWLREALERLIHSDSDLLQALTKLRDETADKAQEMRRMSAAARMYRLCGGDGAPDNVVPFAARRKKIAPGGSI